MARTMSRRDICSILLVSKVLNAEATKLIHDRSSIRVYLAGPNILPCLGRVGRPRPGNTFRSITIYLYRGTRVALPKLNLRTYEAVEGIAQGNTARSRSAVATW